MDENNSFTLPRPDQRVLILGSTGSGKTTVGAWLLSEANFDQMPWVIIDYKRDSLLGAIDRTRQIGLNDIPKEPGLYHLKPNPVSDDERVEDWLLRIWKQRNIGLYVDEALRLPTSRKTGAFETILTQGRSLHIPVIALSQRPVDLTRYAFSEANHVVVMRLTDLRDRKKVTEYVPDVGHDYKLKKYHSIWYSVDDNKKYTVRPVPDGSTLLTTLEARLKALQNVKRRLI
jgi:DNA helicase HerA-like ATPase